MPRSLIPCSVTVLALIVLANGPRWSDQGLVPEDWATAGLVTTAYADEPLPDEKLRVPDERLRVPNETLRVPNDPVHRALARVDAARAAGGALVDVPSDSALDELAAGRYWHAALALRAERMADSEPEHVLLLASAEAGWNNWTGVRLLLQGAEWLEDVGEGDGLFLLGRALERAERWAAAAAAFDRYVEIAGGAAAERSAARVRGVRALWRAGEREAAEQGLEMLVGTPTVQSWLAADLIGEAVAEGDTMATRTLLSRVSDEVALDRLWRAEADAFLAADDPDRARATFEALVERLESEDASDRRVAEARVEAGLLRLAAGDTTAALDALTTGVDNAPGSALPRAAAALVDIGGQDADASMRLAAILNRSGDGRRALRAYDRAHRLTAELGDAMPASARLERARLMATVRDRQDEALEEFRALRESLDDEGLAARNLEIWAQMRERQGRTGDVRTLRGWLVEEYPGSDQAAEVVFMRGYDAEQSGRVGEALRHYEAVAEAARTHSRAGQARMRAGQIHLARGETERAARTFEAYLEDFPEGRRWEEAAYWAGRTRLEAGDREAGLGHLRRVMGQPISYYAVMAADLAEEAYTVDLEPGVEPVEPDWLTEGLARLDVLTDAELRRGADAEVARLRDRARGDRAVTVRLAEALIERGLTIDGINLGWALVEEGGWDRTVLRITFPFPYRELVRREAEEWGVDPIMLAALIRQESAFKADIVSHAGAIGLMQVMPPTGAQLARAHGPVGFTSDALSNPEVNLHLGSAFLVEMTRRFDGALPLVLSAYNAGPSRAVRWREFPEVSDELRFTERIPFVETRGYVKNVRRNLGLYRVLYGEDEEE
jgi:soluble lytic murein transglycosylase